MDHGAARQAPAAASAVLATAALAIATAATLGESFVLAAAGAALLLAAALALARTVSWHVLLGALVLVIVFIPIRRYTFSTGLPIQLEPYRVLVALLLAGWVACLLVDERIRLRRTGLEAPIVLVGLAAVGSVLANPGRVASAQPEVIKSLSFLASFLLIFFLVSSVTSRLGQVEAILKTLVIGMAVVGALAVVESQTGASPFGRLNELLPLLHESSEIVRGAGTRARGPAEHPIALGAALVLTVPVAFYLATTARTFRVAWWGAVGLLAIGTLATLSRTGVVMLVAVAAVYVGLRPRETVRLWPVLLPFLAVVHLMAPGTLGTIRYAFFPEGGVVAEQQRDVGGDCDASGRIADVGPTLEQVSERPLLGVGYGTRIVSGEKTNACILDSQVLGTLVETGTIGLLAWIWFFARFIRRLGQAAAARTPTGDLCVALAASITAYAIGMFTFDALGFIQVTFVLFLLMGFAASILMRANLASEATQEVRTPAPRW